MRRLPSGVANGDATLLAENDRTAQLAAVLLALQPCLHQTPGGVVAPRHAPCHALCWVVRA